MSVSPFKCFGRFGLVEFELVSPCVALEAVFIPPLLSGSEVFDGPASLCEAGFGSKLSFAGLGRQSQASWPYSDDSTTFFLASEPSSGSIFGLTRVS